MDEVQLSNTCFYQQDETWQFTDLLQEVFVLIWQETQRLMTEPVQGIKAIPDECNARYFKVVVDGPKEVF